MAKGFSFIVGILLSVQAFAQTGIGTTTPNASAKLEVAATDKGFLLPRLTSAQKDAIVSPANGLLVYQTDAVAGFYVNSGTPSSKVWTRVNMDWTRTGNDISYTAGNISTSGTLAGGNTSTSSISGFAANLYAPTLTSNAYTLQASDNGKILTFNNATAVTLNVPSLFTGFNCMIIQLGAGQVVFTQSGTTITNRSSFNKTAGANAIATLVGISASSFIAAGDMSN